MAGSLNKCCFIGNLGADPEVKSIPSGSKVANFSLACTDTWKDKNSGERKERTEWVRVVVWSEGLIGVLERYVKKGSKVYIEGQMQTRKYEKDGQDHYATEIVLQGFGSQLVMLDGRQDGGGGNDAGDRQESKTSSAPAKSSDDIPF